ncbi:MAG: integral rane sensor signal transduction histidine kinase [Phycisphaerales bacterium]|nr:integral rane sensor signal transduction histidine kinase [Phycisphaerales bacterium]
MARRLSAQLGLLLGCLLLTALGAVWGVRGLRQDFSQALDGYERLRQLYLVGFHLQSARAAMTSDFPDFPRARLELRRAQQLHGQMASSNAATADGGVAEALERAAVAAEANRPSVTVLDLPLAAMNERAESLRQGIASAQRMADRRQQVTLIALLALITLTVMASIWIARRQVRAVLGPLKEISHGVRRVAAGQLETPFAMQQADVEFASLAHDFNDMALQLHAGRSTLEARVEAATRALVQSERLAGVGLLAAGVAHEINNPLSIIAARIELLRAKPVEPAINAALADVLEEVFRCKTIIERLLQLSRGAAGHRELMDVGRVAADVVQAVRPLPAAAGRAWSVDVAPATIRADAGELRQVMLNLLLNAIQFTPPDGAIRVQVRSHGDVAAIEVADDGQGIAPTVMNRLFEPFYSTAAGERRGTGLGLAISKSIVESHDGSLEVFSDGIGHGSRFVIKLPIVRGG